MSKLTSTSFQDNVLAVLDDTIKSNKPTFITTKSGNAVLLSEEEYSGLLETLHLLSHPATREKLLTAKASPLSECIREDELDW